MIKIIIAFAALEILLSACGPSGGASSAASSPVQATPISSPTPSSSPSPSPSASPWGGFSGAGDLANPYQVTTADDVNHITDFPAAYFELTGNIDMTGVNFIPITNFSGVIQGHLYALQNFTMQVTGGQPAAFAITLSGIVNQLYMTNILVSSDTNYAAAYAFNLSGTLSNSQIESGSITSPEGGNGNGIGTGTPMAVNRINGSVETGDEATVDFNGNSFFQTY